MTIEEIEHKREIFRVNERGNVYLFGFLSQDRYLFDFDLCTREKGWGQYDTTQDARYFGVWVHEEKRLVMTYAEGDLTLTVCGSKDSYHEELANMSRFYGPVPRAFAMVFDDGRVEEVYDQRPV